MDIQDYFVPSEVARLILGYLKERNFHKSFNTFLRECPDLTEYWQLLRTGKNPATTILGHGLTEILNEFAKHKLNCLAAGYSDRQYVHSPQQIAVQQKNVHISQTDVHTCLETEKNDQLRREKKRVSDQKRDWRRSSENRRKTHPWKRADNPTITASSLVKGKIPGMSHEQNSLASTVVASSSVKGNLPSNSCHISEATQETQVTNCLADISHQLLETSLGFSTAKASDEGSKKSDEFDFLDRLLEETQIHEKLAENINRALQSVDAENGLGGDQHFDAGDAAAHLLTQQKLNTNAKDLDINHVIAMTESDPVFQNFLKMFQHASVPIGHFDVTEIDVSDTRQSLDTPNCISETVLSCREENPITDSSNNNVGNNNEVLTPVRDNERVNNINQEMQSGMKDRQTDSCIAANHFVTLSSPPFPLTQSLDDNSPRKLTQNLMKEPNSYSLPASLNDMKETSEIHSSFTQVKQYDFVNSEKLHRTQSMRTIISVHSENVPYIPKHCRKVPSRRIRPTNLRSSHIPSSLCLTSSADSQIIKTHELLSTLPEGKKQIHVSTLSEDKTQRHLSTLPEDKTQEHVSTLSEDKTQEHLSTLPEGKTLEHISTLPEGLLLQEKKIRRPETAQLETLGIKLPPSPSKRKPRRIKTVQLSSNVNNSFEKSAAVFKASLSSPIMDDAKIVSSSSDFTSSQSEVEAFRMLSLLTSSYSKPQPRQEITSTNEILHCICDAALTCEHHISKNKSLVAKLQSEKIRDGTTAPNHGTLAPDVDKISASDGIMGHRLQTPHNHFMSARHEIYDKEDVQSQQVVNANCHHQTVLDRSIQSKESIYLGEGQLVSSLSGVHLESNFTEINCGHSQLPTDEIEPNPACINESRTNKFIDEELFQSVNQTDRLKPMSCTQLLDSSHIHASEPTEGIYMTHSVNSFSSELTPSKLTSVNSKPSPSFMHNLVENSASHLDTQTKEVDTGLSNCLSGALRVAHNLDSPQKLFNQMKLTESQNCKKNWLSTERYQAKEKTPFPGGQDDRSLLFLAMTECHLPTADLNINSLQVSAMDYPAASPCVNPQQPLSCVVNTGSSQLNKKTLGKKSRKTQSSNKASQKPAKILPKLSSSSSTSEKDKLILLNQAFSFRHILPVHEKHSTLNTLNDPSVKNIQSPIQVIESNNKAVITIPPEFIELFQSILGEAGIPTQSSNNIALAPSPYQNNSLPCIRQDSISQKTNMKEKSVNSGVEGPISQLLDAAEGGIYPCRANTGSSSLVFCQENKKDTNPRVSSCVEVQGPVPQQAVTDCGHCTSDQPQHILKQTKLRSAKKTNKQLFKEENLQGKNEVKPHSVCSKRNITRGSKTGHVTAKDNTVHCSAPFAQHDTVPDSTKMTVQNMLLPNDGIDANRDCKVSSKSVSEKSKSKVEIDNRKRKKVQENIKSKKRKTHLANIIENQFSKSVSESKDNNALVSNSGEQEKILTSKSLSQSTKKYLVTSTPQKACNESKQQVAPGSENVTISQNRPLGISPKISQTFESHCKSHYSRSTLKEQDPLRDNIQSMVDPPLVYVGTVNKSHLKHLFHSHENFQASVKSVNHIDLLDSKKDINSEKVDAAVSTLSSIMDAESYTNRTHPVAACEMSCKQICSDVIKSPVKKHLPPKKRLSLEVFQNLKDSESDSSCLISGSKLPNVNDLNEFRTKSYLPPTKSNILSHVQSEVITPENRSAQLSLSREMSSLNSSSVLKINKVLKKLHKKKVTQNLSSK
ncbi:hypothetical protein Btru_000353 [Bulinus truncatus]|nr:hypothetical protein Btru_000353 [Bulinus truncatus]